DGQNYYSSRYDGRYNSSFMIGKEFEINGRNMLQFSFRNLVYGGQWYASPDDEITARTREYYPDPLQANNRQVDAYWRSDIRISYRKNNPGNAWMIALDVQNMFNIENPRFEIWNIQANAYDWRNQAGIIPVISYQVDF
ncbi:MAG: hypothetical protein HKO89_01835, partial [Saprospiraceae bacterium]|nr:hypothetical protein [Saprospiraceae bacterium]